jgi:hypothetical protein
MPGTNDQNAPLTRSDLDRIVEAITLPITQQIQAATAELRAAIEASEVRKQEFARTIETNLLAAFHGHAKDLTVRFHAVETNIHDLSLRMATLEERVLNIETRRPPQ